jgi:dihydrofolate reductase
MIRAPVFVVTHRPAETIVKRGGTSYIFVTEGIENALLRAREAAGSDDVQVNGGADIARQFFEVGKVDVTLDSFMAQPDNELDFMVGDEELDQAFMRELMPRADTIVFGRKAFVGGMASYWPTEPFAQWMNETLKVVPSSTGGDVDQWENSSVATGDAIAHVKDSRLALGRRSWSSAEAKQFRSWSSRRWSMSSGSRSTRLRPVAAGLSSTVASQRWNSSFRRRVAIPQARSPSSTKTRIARSEYRPGHPIRRPQATAGAVCTLPRLPMIVPTATIVNVAPPSIQEHLGYSRTRVAVGCAGSMP